MNRVSFLLFTLFLSACATTQQQMPVASLDNLEPGHALIRVDRRADFMGAGRSLDISDDGRIVGQLGPGKYLVWQRPAGEFRLQIEPAAFAASHPIPLNVKVEAGKQYVFEVFWGGLTFELKPRAP